MVGCGVDEKKAPDIGYYVSPLEELQKIHQVVFVPIITDDVDRQSIADSMTQNLCQGLKDRRMFQVDVLDAKDPACLLVPAGSRHPLTLQQLSAIRQAVRSDAVLFGCMTDFEQYPRMRIGLRLRLIDLRRGKMLWGVDHIWDTTDKKTVERIRQYYDARSARQVDPLKDRMGIVSVQAFQKFVAWEIARTLPHEELDKEEPNGKK